MEIFKTIPSAVAKLIPYGQLQVTKSNLQAFSASIVELEKALNKCPKLYETDGKKEHPAVFHYFFGGSDFYICEYNPEEDLMFGYAILNGDLQNSEWGYFCLSQLTNSKYLNIDYHFQEQSIEYALHQAYPKYFKKPE